MMPPIIIPAKAGIHSRNGSRGDASFASLDSRLRGNDGMLGI
ncbi:hypothetical protein FHT00_003103 [Sphingomonas insulae]|nr:hypothetical protein [Sphingomonas insulae]